DGDDILVQCNERLDRVSVLPSVLFLLHEVGHAHTLTHTATGIMSRGFNNWNRAFMVKEPHFNGPVRPHEEAGAHWHRVDTLRLRFHPSFRLPLDLSRSPHKDHTPTFIPLDSGLEIHAAAGLVMVEFELDGRYKTHIEFPNQNGQPTRLPFSEDDLWRRVGVKPGSGRLRIEATASNTHSAAIGDVTAFFKDRVVTIPGGKCIKSAPAGHRGLNGAETIVPFPPQGARLTKICVHHGDFLDGIVFGFADGTTNIIGTQGGGVTELELAPDEKIERITLQSGAWVDGLEIHTTKGRSTEWCGGRGGGPGSLAPPDRYELVGMWGTAKNWVDSVGILYRKREARVGVAEGKGGDGREGV
ncbi:Jacalin-like lectin domain-containing protein, partial [Jimgerdemannia flammicorona]